MPVSGCYFYRNRTINFVFPKNALINITNQSDHSTNHMNSMQSKNHIQELTCTADPLNVICCSHNSLNPIHCNTTNAIPSNKCHRNQHPVLPHLPLFKRRNAICIVRLLSKITAVDTQNTFGISYLSPACLITFYNKSTCQPGKHHQDACRSPPTR